MGWVPWEAGQGYWEWRGLEGCYLVHTHGPAIRGPSDMHVGETCLGTSRESGVEIACSQDCMPCGSHGPKTKTHTVRDRPARRGTRPGGGRGMKATPMLRHKQCDHRHRHRQPPAPTQAKAQKQSLLCPRNAWPPGHCALGTLCPRNTVPAEDYAPGTLCPRNTVPPEHCAPGTLCL